MRGVARVTTDTRTDTRLLSVGCDRLAVAFVQRIDLAAEDLFAGADSQEHVVVARKATLEATVRREQETELQDKAEALELREQVVAAREREASPSYRTASAWVQS